MAYNSPLWNEESGWAALDNLSPQQTAMIQANPGLITGGMPSGIFNQNTGGASTSPFMTVYQDPATQLPGGRGGRGNSAVSPDAGIGGWQSFSPPPSDVGSFFDVVASGQSNRQPTSGPTPIIGSPSLAPTGAQVAQNPGQYTGTSFDPTRNLMSGMNFPTGGSNNMSMQGAGTVNINGQNYGGYTGSNGPINSQLFNAQAGNMQPGLDYVRGIDQVSYYKYVLPLQQAGLIDISNPQQVQAAITQGLARDGGGSWGGGLPGTTSSSNTVAGSPFARFLTSGDARAQMINQFMLSGNQQAVAAANDWMQKNVRADGSTANALDNIDAWKNRFNSIYFPNGQFNPASISPNGTPPGPQTPPPPGGGGNQTPVLTGAENWFEEYTGQNQSRHTRYNKQLDDWAATKLDPNVIGRLSSRTDSASLAEKRRLLDEVRQRFGYQSWGNINQNISGNSNSAWLAQGYEDSPFAPTTDPGQYYKWNWGDTDPNDANNPSTWYLDMVNPRNYQELQQAINYYNQNFQGKALANFGNYGVYGQNGNAGAISELMFGYMGNNPWQQYNQQVNQFLRGQLDQNSPFLQGTDWLTNSDMSRQYLEQMDALRRQHGYFSNAGVQGSVNGSNTVPLNSYLNATGTPFRPNQAPGQGFKWEWLDPDGAQGATPGTWGQTLIGTPTTLQQATEYANYMNQAGTNGRMYFGGNNFGNIFSQEDLPSGGYRYTPKTSYFQPAQTTPPPGGGGGTNNNTIDWSTIFSGGGSEPYRTPPPLYTGVGSGTGSGSGGTGSGTTPGGATNQGGGNSGPWGGATFRPRFPGNYNMWS